MRERLVPILFTGRSGGEEHNKSWTPGDSVQANRVPEG